MSTVAQLKHRYYYGRPEWRDGTTRYVEFVGRFARPHWIVADIGAGNGRQFAHPLKGRVKELLGVDPDPGVLDNARLDRGIVARAESIPLPDASCHMAVCSFTFEHLDAPDAALREIRRILVPGGLLLFRTPNLWHYVTLGSRCTPHAFHRWAAGRLRRLPSSAAEPYPAYYRINTRRRLRRLMRECGFVERELQLIEPEPSYLQFSAIAFRLGILYERTVNASALLAGMRVTMMGAFERAADEPGVLKSASTTP
jgi:ubiquinone/menaquinone biosynthesis C-methylase UbiE